MWFLRRVVIYIVPLYMILAEYLASIVFSAALKAKVSISVQHTGPSIAAAGIVFLLPALVPRAISVAPEVREMIHARPTHLYLPRDVILAIAGWLALLGLLVLWVWSLYLAVEASVEWTVLSHEVPATMVVGGVVYAIGVGFSEANGGP